MNEPALNTPTNAKREHPPVLKEEAVRLFRMDWGGAVKIARYLSKRHDISLSVWTVQAWLRDEVSGTIDPLPPLPAGGV